MPAEGAAGLGRSRRQGAGEGEGEGGRQRAEERGNAAVVRGVDDDLGGLGLGLVAVRLAPLVDSTARLVLPLPLVAIRVRRGRIRSPCGKAAAGP